MNAIKNFVFCFLFFCLLFQVARADFRDYSDKGGEYQILKNIGLKIADIKFVEKKPVSILDKTFESSTFLLRTREVAFYGAPAIDAMVNRDILVEYELTVGKDLRNEIRDDLLQKLYTAAITTTDEPRKFDDIGMVYKNNSYLLYWGNSHAPDLVWFGDRFMHLKFKRFVESPNNKREGTTKDFWKEKIQFVSNGNELQLKPEMKNFELEFLRLYKEGRFREN